MKNVGELAVDLGGVSQDVKSGFWQEVYEKLCDGSTILVPVVHPHSDTSSLPVLSKILSHSYIYLCTGFLPTQISFTTLAAILLRTGVEIESTVLIESFFDHMSNIDRSALSIAVEFAKHASSDKYPPDLQEMILTALSAFG